jgi:hypothetical protein
VLRIVEIAPVRGRRDRRRPDQAADVAAGHRGTWSAGVANANAFPVRGRLAGRSAQCIGKRRAALRARSLTVPARASRTVALKLPKIVQRRLKRSARIALRLTASVTDPTGVRRVVTRRITVRRR